MQPTTSNLRYTNDIQSSARLYTRRAALALFSLYLAVFPGSTITVALDLVPAWGEWMGGALLLLQGAIVLCWLVGSYGRRGALASVLVFLLAWGVEHLGVATGFPFGRYSYTTQLQPQLLGVVPLAIPCAWLMVAVGAWQIADCRLQIADYGSRISEQRTKNKEQLQGHVIRKTQHATRTMFLAATLVLLLDLQIEPVATAINRYWVWLDGGAYYGVPAANFAAWWGIGLMMAVVVAWTLGSENREPPRGYPTEKLGPEQRTKNEERRTRTRITYHASWSTFYALRFTLYAIPACLYLLNTLMFAAINLARGYIVAGAVGLVVLVVLGLIRITVAIKQKAFTIH
jgi:putative membrane protein